MPRGVYRREMETRECENPHCRQLFAAVKGRKARWCRSACKQAGYRLRRWKQTQEGRV